MRNLLRFLIRYHQFILFLILEIIAFILIAQYSTYQRASIFRFKHSFLGNIETKADNFGHYLDLKRENRELVKENARLYNLLPSTFYNPLTPSIPDTTLQKKFVYLNARIINNSTNKQFNFLILDQGLNQGFKPEMAVVSSNGIVGMIKECSENFSSVISVLNREFFPNAMIKRNGYQGYIEWPGLHYQKVVLKEIPIHAEVQIGDTIITSGFSSIFPKGILIGTVSDYEPYDGTFHKIHVKLSTDYKNLSEVMIIKNLMSEEQLKLEESLADD